MLDSDCLLFQIHFVVRVDELSFADRLSDLAHVAMGEVPLAADDLVLPHMDKVMVQVPSKITMLQTASKAVDLATTGPVAARRRRPESIVARQKGSLGGFGGLGGLIGGLGGWGGNVRGRQSGP